MQRTIHRDTRHSSLSCDLHLTLHAHNRMHHRGIDASAVDAVIDYGRVIYTRGAVVHAIGRKEIARWAEENIDLSAYDGIQVVCAIDGTVLTVYRNRNFRRLRTGMGRGRHNSLGCLS